MHPSIVFLIALPQIILLSSQSSAALPQSDKVSEGNRIIVELYLTESAQSHEVLKAVQDIAEQNKYLAIESHVIAPGSPTPHLEKIQKHFQLKSDAFPIIHCCSQAVSAGNADEARAFLTKALRIEIIRFRKCKSCAHVPELQSSLQKKYPALTVDVINYDDEGNSVYAASLTKSIYGAKTPKYPFVHMCGVGLDASRGQLNAEDLIAKKLANWVTK